MGNALFRRKGEIIDPVHRLEGRDHIHSQRIYRPLDQELANRLAGLLKSRNTAVTQCLFQKCGIDPKVLFARMKQRDTFFYVYPCKNCGYALRNNGGNGRTDDSEPQTSYKNQIQESVQQGSKHQEFYRSA